MCLAPLRENLRGTAVIQSMEVIAASQLAASPLTQTMRATRAMWSLLRTAAEAATSTSMTSTTATMVTMVTPAAGTVRRRARSRHRLQWGAESRRASVPAPLVGVAAPIQPLLLVTLAMATATSRGQKSWRPTISTLPPHQLRRRMSTLAGLRPRVPSACAMRAAASPAAVSAARRPLPPRLPARTQWLCDRTADAKTLLMGEGWLASPTDQTGMACCTLWKPCVGC